MRPATGQIPRKAMMQKAAAVQQRSAAMRNLGLKQLVEEILERIPAPHTEDIVEDVFLAIEQNPVWRRSYDRMVYEAGKPAITSWAGFWIAHIERRVGEGRESAARSTLIESYSKLVTPEPKRGKKLREPEALKAMHEHYLANRATLPADVRDYREVIVALIMEGVGIEDAFARALEKRSFAW